MGFRWRYEDADGQQVSGLPDQHDEFDDQTEAEAWFTEVWPELRSAGVAQVVLLDDGARVYGPMGLDEA